MSAKWPQPETWTVGGFAFARLAPGQPLRPHRYQITSETVATYWRSQGFEGSPPGWAGLVPLLLLDTLHPLKKGMAMPEGALHARRGAHMAPTGAGRHVALGRNDGRGDLHPQRAPVRHLPPRGVGRLTGTVQDRSHIDDLAGRERRVSTTPLTVGQTLGSTTRVIAQQQVDAYGAAGGSNGKIHIDPEWSLPRYGSTLAQAMMVLGAVELLLASHCTPPTWVRAGSPSAKFLAPMRPGDQKSIRADVDAVGKHQARCSFRCLNQDGDCHRRRRGPYFFSD